MKRADLDPRDAHPTALRMLAARELSERQVRERLARRGFPEGAVAEAVSRLAASGAIDDRRVAFAFAKTRVRVRRHGRARVLRELEAIGIARDLARDAVAEAFAGVDESRMIAEAIARRRRGGGPIDPGEARRLHASLIRQGFSADAVVRALRALAHDAVDDE